MAKTNKDRLIETFVARNRRAGTAGLRTNTPRVMRPKQYGPDASSVFRPYKGGVDPRTLAARQDVANKSARHDVKRGPRARY